MNRGNWVQTTLKFPTKRKADSDLDEIEPKMSRKSYANVARTGAGSTSYQNESSDTKRLSQNSSSQGSSGLQVAFHSSGRSNNSYEDTRSLDKNDSGQSSQNKLSDNHSQRASTSYNKQRKSDTEDDAKDIQFISAASSRGASSQRQAEHCSGKDTFDNTYKPKSYVDKDDDSNHSPASSEDYKAKNKLELFQMKGIQIYSEHLPELKGSESHTVLFKFSQEGKRKIIYPERKEDFIFEDHAYLPNSSKEKFEKSEPPRWRRIVVALKKKISGVFELEEAMLFYNEQYSKIWKFDALYRYFLEMKEEKRDTFFEEVLPKIQNLALRLPELFKKSVPLLKQRQSRKITMSQEQAACLLANAFFCTFPKRSFKVRGSKMPDINFSNLYSDKHADRKQQKLKCIFNYFERVTTEMPAGTLTFTRQSFMNFEDLPDWENSKQLFSDLFVSDENTIEDDGKYMLQADFANKYVGGGVLGHGLVQEEIRFMLCPEMIVARLFTECLLDTEVLIMTGCERFSSYTGYSDTFKFKEPYIDDMERDNWERRYTEVVAMDALVIKIYKEQFEKWQLNRELNKAYCAFNGKYKEDEYHRRNLDLPAVCTGNWGCGAFGGDKQLKALIQLMAAAAAQRDVCYFTFGDKELSSQLREIHQVLQRKKLQVKNIIELIKHHHKENLSYSSKSNKSLFEYILQFSR
ncbi:poly(ADP-ribose) glycohydrolase-like [Physella acuta]|uniref:poly(ADP-ribose) glycohydrolase-like n=1 Tax=Physella acuta TaxID=109671 RepID=UPI0027DD8A75|nr:poly(ADP-ribose) glycohydrolase-like [Physella acuta]